MKRPSAPALRRLLGGPRRWLTVLVAGALVAAAGVAAVRGTGYPPARVTLAGGTAWLASPGQQLVTLVDGPSELVVGSVRLPVRDDSEVVQVGSSALVVDPDAGTVRRVDGATYEVSDPVRFAGGGGLTVLAGRSAAYLVDSVHRTASALDPATLAAGAEVPLAAAPGPGQTLVDDANRLWVVDGAAGGLTGFTPRDGRMSPVRSSGVGPTARLTLVQGRAAVVDPARHEAALVADDAGLGRSACFPAGDATGMQLLGSATGPRLYAAMPATGTLLVSELDTGECPAAVPVGRPGDRFGPLVESNGFVLVPNETTGELAAVDVKGRVVREELPVLPTTPSKLELVAKDGLVFYNDLVGERAGVIRFDGRWTASAGEKFRVRDGQPDTVLASGAGDIPPGAAPPAPPPRGRAAAAGRPARPPVVGGAPAAPVPPPAGPPTTAPTLVEVPDFSSVLHQEYANAIFYIDDRIRERCGGQLCLTPVTRVADTAPASAAPAPCVITNVPAAGVSVARGSTLTFFVDRPCGTGTTTSTATATATSEPTTEPPTSSTPPPVVIDPAPTRLTRVPLDPSVRAPATGGAGATPAPRPRPTTSVTVEEPAPTAAQPQAPDAATPPP